MSEPVVRGLPIARQPGAGDLKPYLQAIAAAALMAVLLRGCVAQGYRVPSGSMLPTLQVGDHILVSRWPYGIPLPLPGAWLWRGHGPRPGDVVVLERAAEPGAFFVKRVAAVAGEIVEIVDGALVVDGRRRDLAGDRLPSRMQANFRPLRVPPAHVFVLGDNRDQSVDSRDWGPVDVAGIKGRVLLIYWSQTKSGGRIRWQRLLARVN